MGRGHTRKLKVSVARSLSFCFYKSATMARPRKENADYFPHDSGMRNHRKVKALRSKFWIEWYAIRNMMLEHLISCDFFEAKIDDVEREIIAWDFGTSCDRLRQIVEYMLQIWLLQKEWETYKSVSMKEIMKPLTDKRDRQRNRVSATETTQPVAENPQSKVKNSKLKKSKENNTSITVPTKKSWPILESVSSFVSHQKAYTQVAWVIKRKWLEWHLAEDQKQYKALLKIFSAEQIDFVLRWIPNDHFWCDKAMSIASLRKKKDWVMKIEKVIDAIRRASKKQSEPLVADLSAYDL